MPGSSTEPESGIALALSRTFPVQICHPEIVLSDRVTLMSSLPTMIQL
jgi:hypothetical protein